MVKATCVVLGLVFLALGILGITGVVPMFSSDPIYVNMGEIVLGAMGLLVGIYAQQKRENSQQRKENSEQKKENFQLRKEKDDRQKNENDQLRKDNELQRKVNEQQRRVNYDQWKNQNDQQGKEKV